MPRIALLMLLAALAGCELVPHSRPLESGHGGSGVGAQGGSVAMGGLGGAGGSGGSGGEAPPCDEPSTPGLSLAQTGFAALGAENIQAAAMAPDGSVWIALAYDQPFDIDATVLETPDGVDVALLHLDPNGVLMAADRHRVHGTGDQRITRLIEREGALYVLITTTDAVSIDDTPIAGISAGDTLLSSIGAATAIAYGLRATTLTANALLVESETMLWVVGSFEGTLELRDGATVVTSAAGTSPVSNGFAARLALDDTESLTVFGPPAGMGSAADEAHVAGIIPFTAEEVVVFGDFRGALALGAGGYEAPNFDLWVAQVRADGLGDRSRFGGDGDARATTIVESRGRGVIVGTYTGDLGFGDPPLGPGGMYLAQVKLNDLHLSGSRELNSPTGELIPTAVAPYPWGSGLLVTGQLSGASFSFDMGVMVNDDAAPDAFLLAVDGNFGDRFAWHVQAGGAELPALASAPCQPVVVAGSHSATPASARQLGQPPLWLADSAAADAFLLHLSY